MVYVRVPYGICTSSGLPAGMIKIHGSLLRKNIKIKRFNILIVYYFSREF